MELIRSSETTKGVFQFGNTISLHRSTTLRRFSSIEWLFYAVADYVRKYSDPVPVGSSVDPGPVPALDLTGRAVWVLSKLKYFLNTF